MQGVCRFGHRCFSGLADGLQGEEQTELRIGGQIGFGRQRQLTDSCYLGCFTGVVSLSNGHNSLTELGRDWRATASLLWHVAFFVGGCGNCPRSAAYSSNRARASPSTARREPSAPDLHLRQSATPEGKALFVARCLPVTDRRRWAPSHSEIVARLPDPDCQPRPLQDQSLVCHFDSGLACRGILVVGQETL